MVGTIRAENGRVKLRFAHSDRALLEPAIETLRCYREAALLALYEAAVSSECDLKGQAVELWCEHAGGRVFIVADEEDAQEAIQRFGAGRGEVWTGPEIELIGRFKDRAIRDEVAAFKRQFDGRLSPDTAAKSSALNHG